MRSWARALTAGLTLCLAFGSAACAGDESPTDSARDSATKTEQTKPISVVASINQWGSLAKQIGGGHVNVTSILSSTGVDAHDFEPKTSDIAKLQKAQVVVSNGAGYDSWSTKNLERGVTAISAAQTVGAAEGDNPHLWFSTDARNAMAKELANAYSRIMPRQKKYFSNRLAKWTKREDAVEKTMRQFKSEHGDVPYAATEQVAYYLLSDMGLTDKTPQGYLRSTASGGEPAPKDLQGFQELLEKRKVDLLVNNTQESSDASNMLTGTAHKSDVPVFDVSEQMPADSKDLTAWIASLVESLDTLLDQEEESERSDDGSATKPNADDADGTNDGDDSNDADSGGQPEPGE